MSALSEHYAGKECPGDYDEKDIDHLTSWIWYGGADHETARLIARMLLKKGRRLVPYSPTTAMYDAAVRAGATVGNVERIYTAMIEAARGHHERL